MPAIDKEKTRDISRHFIQFKRASVISFLKIFIKASIVSSIIITNPLYSINYKAQAEEVSLNNSLGNLAAEIGISTSSTVRDQLISDFLDKLVDGRSLRKYFTNPQTLKKAIAQKIDASLSKLPKGGKLVAGILVTLVTDIIADELKDYFVAQKDSLGPELSVSLAAFSWVAVKQTSIYFTSGGNPVVIGVGEAFLLWDIAKKNYSAIKDFKSALDLERKSKISNSLYNLYFKYYLIYLKESDPLKSAQLFNEFEIEVKNLRDTTRSGYLPYFDYLFDDLSYNLNVARNKYLGYGPWIPEPCPTSGCTFIPVPVKDPIIGGTPPISPVSSGIWFGALTGVTYDTYSYVDSNGNIHTGNSRTSITDGVASGVNGNTPIVDGSTTIALKKLFENEDNSFGTLTVPDNNATVKRQYFKSGYFGNLDDSSNGTYKYAAWGRWNGNLGVEGNDGVGNFSVPVKKGFWVIGDLAKSSAIDKRSGSANYKGHLIGDLLESGTTSVLTAALVGNVVFDINFTSDTVSGNLDIRRAITGETWLNQG
jgi:hypothetical protein